jgi:hypothetical protein
MPANFPPGAALRSVTRVSVYQRLAPKLKPAKRSSLLTSDSASADVAAMNGKIMTASISEAANIVSPVGSQRSMNGTSVA